MNQVTLCSMDLNSREKNKDKIVIYGARKIWIVNILFFSRQSEAGHALLTLERHDVFAEKKQDKIVNYAWNATRHDYLEITGLDASYLLTQSRRKGFK